MIDKKHDVLGDAILDYFQNKSDKNILVNTNVAFEEQLSPSYFFRSFDQMPHLEQDALRLCKGKILDIGAGAGSHSLYLQNNNFDVTALEISPGAIEVMKLRGVKQILSLNFNELKNQKFDTLLFLMNGFGMAETINNVVPFIHHCFELLNDNGQILFDSTDLIYLYKQEDGSYLFDLNANYYGEVEYKLSYRGKNSIPFKWLYLDNNYLLEMCKENNITIKVIAEDTHYQYLAKITK